MTTTSRLTKYRVGPRLGFVWRETVLILVWSYVFLLGGSVSGLIAYPLQVLSTGFLAIVTLVWLGGRLLYRSRVPMTGLEWPALAFLAVQVAATWLSQDTRRGLPLLAQSVAYGLIVSCTYDAIRSGWPAAQVERTLLLVGSVVVALVGWDVGMALSGWWKLVVEQVYTPDFQYRSYAVFGDANLLAAVLNLTTILAVGRTWAAPTWRSRMLPSVLAAGAVAGQVVTRSRGGAAGLTVGLLTLAVLWMAVVSPATAERARRFGQWMRARRILLVTTLLVLAAMMGLVAWRALSFSGSATQAPALSARSAFWRVAWRAFESSPIWGHGPGTYATDYMRAGSVPPDRPYLHAHSVPFTTAAESGILGLGALLLVSAAIARQIWRARHKLSSSARARWAAGAACWACFAAHSQVDDHTRFLAVAVPLAIVLGYILAEETPVLGSASGQHARHRGAASQGPWWRGQSLALSLTGLALAAVAFQAGSLRAYGLANRAVEAGLASDWQASALGFDGAAAIDSKLAFYPEQAGYAYSRLAALGEDWALALAISRYRRAVELEPDYALHYANLAALYWQAGQEFSGLEAIRQATVLAPQADFLYLNLGAYEEALGNVDAATAAYRTALGLDLLRGQGSFWSQTRLRSTVREAWLAEAGLLDVDGLDPITRLIAGDQAGLAERQLVERWRQNRQDPLVYAGLAHIAFSRGDLQLAQHYLDTAFWVQTLEVETRIPAIALAAEIARQQGRIEAALAAYHTVFVAVTDYGSYGWGTAGWTPHASFVFQRRALPLDLVPQVQQSGLTPELARRLLPLVELYTLRGENERAEQVLQVLAGDVTQK